MKNHPIAFYPLAILFSLSFVLISPAQEPVKEPVQAEAKQDLFKQVLGYWVVDFDSAETKTFVAEMIQQGATADVQKEMEATTFEFKLGQMLMHQAGNATIVKIMVKSQDLEKHILVADFQTDDDEPIPSTLRINENLLVLTGKEPEGKDASFGLKRIDEETFKKRVPEPKDDQSEEKEQKQQVIEVKEGYPVATPVPNKPGFVFSPYNKLVIDVTAIPSGVLVIDPHFPPTEKKFFRVP